MRMILCRSRLIGSYAIRWMTFSQWSHCAIMDGGEVIEATWPKVRSIPFKDFVVKHPDYEILEFDLPDEKAGIEFARAQIDKPYDLNLIKGWLAHRDWQEDGKWDCAELVATSLLAGGKKLFRDGSLSHVTPQNLWMIAP
jgi:uncharacterized protein YycO